MFHVAVISSRPCAHAVYHHKGCRCHGTMSGHGDNRRRTASLSGNKDFYVILLPQKCVNLRSCINYAARRVNVNLNFIPRLYCVNYFLYISWASAVFFPPVINPFVIIRDDCASYIDLMFRLLSPLFLLTT